MSNTTFLIALGANLPSAEGPPAQTLVQALRALTDAGLELRALSRFYRSPAFPAGSGPDYVNACAALTAALSPQDVLAALHHVEAQLGRERHGRWAARGIDLDLIAAEGRILPDSATQSEWRCLPLDAQMRLAPDRLILPHPRLQDRAFVLIPLAEIAPHWRHPATGQCVADMLEGLPSAEKAALEPFSTPFGWV